ncbi:MAG TPA: glutamine--fructose-6-phosphate transaminase (isomerizing) [Methylomirabilota bacterium]|nr:glutamine--fructose-6-phosphate transaminase (isomerizing) [Methylomirabilota bacterium]
MCGIVGYVGERDAVGILLDGLGRLEYRGYDSAGLVVQAGASLVVRRSVGKIARLRQVIEGAPVAGRTALGHTRWATHGRPSDANAHPHVDCSGRVAVVHNGILENYLELKGKLEAEGHTFRSETDTEVMAHLVESELPRCGDLVSAVKAALRQIRGAYAFCLLSADEPGRIIAAKRGGGAVVVGLGDGEVFVASDIPAVIPHTRQVVILEDDEVAVIGRDGLAISTLEGASVERTPSVIAWDAAMAQKGGYDHFMLKEIHEQPEAVAATFRGRVNAETGEVRIPEANLTPELVARLRRVVLVSCGTSYHAGLVARLMIERLAGLSAEVDLASEFRYRDPVVGPDTLVVAISQSGETADTLGAAKTARLKGASVLAITNIVGSALAREADGVIYTHAGPEIGVASTKTFTATITAAYVLALALGLQRGALTATEAQKRASELLEIPGIMTEALRHQEPVAELARRLFRHENFLYLGRGVHYPIALEGALKLKEISYIHAEGYAGGEMKHGPIALIDETMPVVALVPRDGTYERMAGNVEEVKARGGRIIAVAHPGDTAMARRADHVLEVPPAVDLLAPLVTVIPLQLLAYHVAIARGCDVDQPRNLAKSVTVE